MSKFILINPKLVVNKEQIGWVSEHEDGLSSIVSVWGKEYPCDIPFRIISNIVMQEENNPVMEKLDNYLSVAQITST